MNGRLLVVETQGRVVTHKGSVEESQWVAEGKVWDDWESWSCVSGLWHFGDSGACGSEDWQTSVDCWKWAENCMSGGAVRSTRSSRLRQDRSKSLDRRDRRRRNGFRISLVDWLLRLVIDRAFVC